MNQINFKGTSRRIVIELAVVIALVSYNISFSKVKSNSQAWKFVFTHPTVLLHVLVGTIVVVEAIMFLVRSVRSHDRFWTVLAAIGLVFVLLSFASGEYYVATQKSSGLSYMGDAAAGALITYGFGWYWGHKKAKAVLAK
jgi:hypothetical protein